MAWWITPTYVARVPSDYNKTRTYDGTIRSLFNPAALASGNLAGAIRTGLPAKLTDQVKVQQTSGNTALVQDTRTIDASGKPVAMTTSHYAVNRQTLAATSSHPSNWSVMPATGLTVSWPLGAKQQNYTGWVYLTDTTTPLKYVKQAQQGGINTYQYHATVAPTPIKNPQTLASLPKTLPVSLLPRLSAAGIIPASDRCQPGAGVPACHVDPARLYLSGQQHLLGRAGDWLVVNVSNNEIEMAGIALPAGTIIPLIPVLADTYHASPSSLSAAVTDANNGSSTISTWGVIVPIVAAAVGFVLVVLAVLLWIRGRSRGRPVDVSHGQRHPSPVGSIS